MTAEINGPLPVIKSHISGAYLGGAPLENDQDLVMSGLLDSLAVMRLVAYLEEAFGIAIPARDVTIAMLRDPASIAAYVAMRRGDGT